MARIDDLLAHVADPHLRERLRAAVAEIRDSRQFGLVFEQHLPETVLLPGLKVRKGALVTRRDGSWNDEWVVESIDDGEALLRHPQTDEQRKAAAADLIVVKPFGDPVYPVLTPLGKVARGGERPWHAAINGENYHALQLLLYLCEGQVDCIYLDPPYNTGARDWTYNNRFVDANDSYRHSKWLSFMEKRLRLARRLLSSNGVLVVTIDEHEVHHLGMLLEKIFSDFRRQMVTIVINPKGVTQGGFSRVEEYAFFCFRGDANVEGRGDDLLTPITTEDDLSDEDITKRPRWKGLLRSGTNARRQDRKNMFYPVLIDPDRNAVVGAGEPLPFDQDPDIEAKIDGLAAAWPVQNDGSFGNWGVGHKLLRQLISKGYVSAGSYDPKRRTWAISYLSRMLQEQIAGGVLEVVSYDAKRNVVDVRYSDIAGQVRSLLDKRVGDAVTVAAVAGVVRAAKSPSSSSRIAFS